MNEWKKKCVGLQRTWVSKRTVFFLSVMGMPPHCIRFKRNFYKEDLLQFWECTQVPTICANVFAVSLAYTKFVVKDFAITARSCNEALLYFPSAMWAFLPPLNAPQMFLCPNWTPSASRCLFSKVGQSVVRKVLSIDLSWEASRSLRICNNEWRNTYVWRISPIHVRRGSGRANIGGGGAPALKRI